MRHVGIVLFVTLIVGSTTIAMAQPPEEPREGGPKPAANRAAAVNEMVSRMLAFDKNNDGKLTRDEIGDSRMQRLFDQADANHDGVVTKDELTAWATKVASEDAGNGPPRGDMGPPDAGPPGGGPPGGGPPGDGPPGGQGRRRGQGGRGFGGRGFGQRSQPGQILSASLI